MQRGQQRELGGTQAMHAQGLVELAGDCARRTSHREAQAAGGFEHAKVG
jgi:hypothetical protein